MNEFGASDRQVKTSLDYIKNVLVTKVPIYLESQRRVYHWGAREVVQGYKVLDCHVTTLGSSGASRNVALDVYHAGIEMEETRIRDDEERHKVVTKEKLIVKKMSADAVEQDIQDTRHLFYVESKMLSDIIPLLLSTSAFITGYYDSKPSFGNISKVSALFPKCYYTSRRSKDPVIVLEDIQTSGYRIGGSKTMLMDLEHVILSLQSLARFHALSYATKKKDPQCFYGRIVHRMRKGKTFSKGKKHLEKMYAHAYFQSLQFTALQPLQVYASKHINGDIKYRAGVESLTKILEDTAGLINRALIPREPLSVLCHGSFHSENILFRYDTNSKPTDVKLIDFQNIHYASPAIDLTFFLFLNSSPELRAGHWNDFFSAYHRTLLSSLSEFLNCPVDALLPEYSIQAFKNEFARHAIYGYVLTAGYVISALSCRADICKVFDMFNNGAPSWEEMDKFITENLKLEGEDITCRLVSLIKELMDEDYLS